MVELPGHPEVPFIAIPHVHPGSFVRTTMSSAGFKLFWYSWVATWVHLDAAVHVLQTDPGKRLNRHALCAEVLQIASNKLKGTGFEEALGSAQVSTKALFNRKPQYSLGGTNITERSQTVYMRGVDDATSSEMMNRHNELWRKAVTSQLPHHKGLSKLTNKNSLGVDVEASDIPSVQSSNWSTVKHENVALLEKWGKAEGQPNSVERQRQVDKLLHEEILSAYSWLSEVFIRSYILEQPAGYWIAACLEPCGKLDTSALFKVTTSGSEDAGILHGINQRRDELQTISADLMKEHEEWEQDCAKRGVHRKIAAIPLHNLDGSAIKINRRGELGLVFCDKDAVPVNIEVHLGFGKSIAPLGPEDLRTIHFTSHGIDIWNNNGHPFRQSDHLATMPVKDLITHGLMGRKLVFMWEAVTGLSAPYSKLLTQFPSLERPASSSLQAGLPIPPKWRKKGQDPVSPEVGDALWLLEQFLDIRFPEGGTFWTTTAEYFPESTDDLNAFLE